MGCACGLLSQEKRKIGHRYEGARVCSPADVMMVGWNGRKISVDNVGEGADGDDEWDHEKRVDITGQRETHEEQECAAKLACRLKRQCVVRAAHEVMGGDSREVVAGARHVDRRVMSPLHPTPDLLNAPSMTRRASMQSDNLTSSALGVRERENGEGARAQQVNEAKSDGISLALMDPIHAHASQVIGSTASSGAYSAAWVSGKEHDDEEVPIPVSTAREKLAKRRARAAQIASWQRIQQSEERRHRAFARAQGKVAERGDGVGTHKEHGRPSLVRFVSVVTEHKEKPGDVMASVPLNKHEESVVKCTRDAGADYVKDGSLAGEGAGPEIAVLPMRTSLCALQRYDWGGRMQREENHLESNTDSDGIFLEAMSPTLD